MTSRGIISKLTPPEIYDIIKVRGGVVPGDTTQCRPYIYYIGTIPPLDSKLSIKEGSVDIASVIERPWKLSTHVKGYKKQEGWKIRNYKLERGCDACGYRKNPAALHFHHLDRATKTKKHISNPNDPEIQKCTLLCANCHYEAEFPEWTGAEPEYDPPFGYK